MDYSMQERRNRAEYRRRQELKRKRKRRRQICFLFAQVAIILVAVLLIVDIRVRLKEMHTETEAAGNFQSASVSQTFEEENLIGSGNGEAEEVTDEDVLGYPDLCYGGDVDKPIERSESEVTARLMELAKENEIIQEIVTDLTIYPEKMLEALANNPEMADFVAGYPDADGSEAGVLTEYEKTQDYPLFLQWDPRWGYAYYGDDSNIGLAGCGPTSLSMALFYLTGDETLTPDKLAEYAMENDYYMYGTGTLWALIEDVPVMYGVHSEEIEIDQWTMEHELDQGNIIITVLRPGDFTATGHFIVIYGYDKNGFYVNDPNCVARSREQWTFAQLEDQIKHGWSLSN